MSRLNDIKFNYENVSEITVDLQIVTGVHYNSAHYKNLQNIVVKLEGNSDVALMINCHFDSESGSYGAGDNGNNCCIMLEILKVFAKSGRKNKHSIIFLFNGSEEGNFEGLHASHGFITQHKWAKDVKAYINLDSAGIDGKEILFRTGPKHDWLVRKYRQTIENPFGNVVMEEFFETNVFKTASDFQIFRDSGLVPGLDIGHSKNAWVYHTKFDHIRYITMESIQNTGNNILALAKALANSDELVSPPEGSPSVYYDFLGLFFVSYTKTVGAVINTIISILAVTIPFLEQTQLKKNNLKIILKETLIASATFIIATVLSIAVCLLMGWIMNFADNAMFWYNATILSLGVYCSSAIIVQVGIFHASSVIANRYWRQSSKNEDKFEKRRRCQAQINGINLCWAVVVILLTSVGSRLGYVLMIMLAISLITNLIIFLIQTVLPKTRKYF